MNVFILLAAAESEGQVAQIARTFGVDWQHLVAQIISFSIVCILLQRYAYRPVLKVLEERRKKIAQGLDDAAWTSASKSPIPTAVPTNPAAISVFCWRRPARRSAASDETSTPTVAAVKITPVLIAL